MDESRARKRSLDSGPTDGPQGCYGDAGSGSDDIISAEERDHGGNRSPSAATGHSYPNRGDSLDVDNLIGQICNRLTALESIADEGTAPQSSSSSSGGGPGYREARIAVFMDVMQCSRQEALFYVDSAAGDVAVAVSLFVEQQQQDLFDGSGLLGNRVEPVSLFTNDNFDSNNMSVHRANHRGIGHIPTAPVTGRKQLYRRREVLIDGLPPGWDAYVSAHTGCVVFRHIESQVRQFQVPPGFADIPDASWEGGPGPSQSKRQRMECADEGGEVLSDVADYSEVPMFEASGDAEGQVSEQGASPASCQSSAEDYRNDDDIH